jgi:hypothetical protein
MPDAVAKQPRRVWRRPILGGLAALFAVAAVWALTPGESRFRSFDPVAVGKAEAELWRAYYERRKFDLAIELALGNHRAFGLSPYASVRSSASATRAARQFQRSRSRAEAQAALAPLTEHFRILAAATNASIDPARAARLELEWWQLRRENVGPEGYAPAVAAATAYLYGLPPERLARYAALRVEAMDLRDAKGDAIGEEDWARITALLVEAYRALGAELHGGPAANPPQNNT